MFKRITILKENDTDFKNVYLKNLHNNYGRKEIFEDKNNDMLLRGNTDIFYNSKNISRFIFNKFLLNNNSMCYVFYNRKSR